MKGKKLLFDVGVQISNLYLLSTIQKKKFQKIQVLNNTHSTSSPKIRINVIKIIPI